MRCGPSFRTRKHLSRGRRLVLSLLSGRPRRYIAGLRGRDNVGGVLAIVGSLLSGRTLFIGRRLQQACGPGVRIHIHLTNIPSREDLRVLFSVLSQTPGRLTLLVGCMRLSKILNGTPIERISGGRLLRHSNISPTILGKLIRGGVFRICPCRVKHLGIRIGSIMSLGPLGRRRRHTCSRVARQFQSGGIYLLRNIASDKGARMCVRLVGRVVQRKGRMLCLLPRVTLAARVARHLGQMFKTHLKVCRSGFPSTRHIRV